MFLFYKSQPKVYNKLDYILFSRKKVMTETKTDTQQQQMLRGTAWMTASNIISRLLGALYIIPWYAWMGKQGDQANALFGQGYNIYALFLLISTAGIPVAIAKQVSKYNTLGKMETSFFLLKRILYYMIGLGLIFGVFMYFASPWMSYLSGGDEDLVRVMRSLSWAVVIFPSMSVLRGFFQGFNNMKPYALSQIAEQIIRVIWMLLATFFIMKIGTGDYVTAVVQSTFAAFIGMLASYGVLFFYLWKEGKLKSLFGKQAVHPDINPTAIVIETFKEAVPFIITGSAIQLFQLIDQWTFIRTMEKFTSYSNSQLQVLYAYLSSNPSKITMILIAVALSIAGVGIPLLTENMVKKDLKGAAKLIINNLQLLLLFIVPAIVGSVILAKPLYTVFYGAPDGQAHLLFVASLIQVIFLALYSVLAPMLQAIFETRKAINYFAIGVLVKAVLQLPLIIFLGALGPVISTAIGLGVPIALMYNHLHTVTHFSRKTVFRKALLICILTVLMAIPVAIFYWLFQFVLSPTSRMGSVIYLVIGGGLGIGVYGVLALVTRMADQLLGARAASLRAKLHIK